MVSKTASIATKRAAVKAPAAARAQKKTKLDPCYKGVVEGLKMTDLPAPVKEMLVTAVPKAFEMVKEERHYSQNDVVELIGQALQGVVEQMSETLSVVTKEVDESEDTHRALVIEEEAKVAAVTEALESCKVAKLLSNQKSEVLEAAKAALAESREAQSQGDVDFKKAKEDEAALEAVMANELTAILEGSSIESDESVSLRQQKLESLTPFLEAMPLEDSLRSSLPTSCLKKADDRGTFDTMVLQQVRTHFEERLQTLRSAVESGKPAAQERAARVAASEAEVLEAQNTFEDSMQRVAEAEAAGEAAASNLEAAQVALREFSAKRMELKQVLQRKTEELEHFKSYNVACFEQLKDKTAKATLAATTTTTTTTADVPIGSSETSNLSTPLESLDTATEGTKVSSQTGVPEPVEIETTKLADDPVAAPQEANLCTTAVSGGA